MTTASDRDSIELSSYIRAGDMVTWGQAAAEPSALIEILMAQRRQLGGIRCFIGITSSEAITADCADHIEFSSFTGGHGSARSLSDRGLLRIHPVPYSSVPRLLSHGESKVDVLLLQLARTAEDGVFSISAAQDYLIAALSSARVVIGQVNARAAATHGDRTIAASELAAIIEVDDPIPSSKPQPPSTVDRAIAAEVASWVEDFSTLQIGIGRIPDAVLELLRDRNDLSIHSGLFSEAMATLVTSGAVSNAHKGRDHGASVASFLHGGQDLLDFAHANPSVQLRRIEYVYDPAVLASLPRFVAVNSALEVDVTGQVNAESVAGRYVGTVGGAGDFLRAAAHSDGGVPIIALPSATRTGSRIVAALDGPTSTARCDVGVIVTEHGSADLRGLPIRERIERMIAIAHPDHRDALADQAQGLRT